MGIRPCEDTPDVHDKCMTGSARQAEESSRRPKKKNTRRALIYMHQKHKQVQVHKIQLSGIQEGRTRLCLLTLAVLQASCAVAFVAFPVARSDERMKVLGAKKEATFGMVS